MKKKNYLHQFIKKMAIWKSNKEKNFDNSTKDNTKKSILMLMTKIKRVLTKNDMNLVSRSKLRNL